MSRRKKSMENPLTWTELHRAVNRALYAIHNEDNAADAVVSVLEDETEGTKLDVEDIKRMLIEHRESMKKGICGLSLTAKIFNAHSRIA